MKKTAGDIIILHMCTKNPDHTMYGSQVTGNDGRTDGKSDKVGAPPKSPT